MSHNTMPFFNPIMFLSSGQFYILFILTAIFWGENNFAEELFVTLAISGVSLAVIKAFILLFTSKENFLRGNGAYTFPSITVSTSILFFLMLLKNKSTPLLLGLTTGITFLVTLARATKAFKESGNVCGSLFHVLGGLGFGILSFHMHKKLSS